MTEIVKCPIPSNLPFAGNLYFDLKPNDPGKQGSYGQMWGVVIKVAQHPELAPGTIARITLSEGPYRVVEKLNPKKGDLLGFIRKETSQGGKKKYEFEAFFMGEGGHSQPSFPQASHHPSPSHQAGSPSMQDVAAGLRECHALAKLNGLTDGEDARTLFIYWSRAGFPAFEVSDSIEPPPSQDDDGEAPW